MNDQNRAGNGRQGRQKAKTGNFRFAQAHLRGVIVRDGPVTRHAQSGAEWVECTLLVGIYDGRQKMEREPPVFVRVRAFGDRAGLLDDYQRGDHVSVAGALVLRVWEDNNGNLREEYQLYADAVSRQAYPQMRELLQAEAPEEARARLTSLVTEKQVRVIATPKVVDELRAGPFGNPGPRWVRRASLVSRTLAVAGSRPFPLRNQGLVWGRKPDAKQRASRTRYRQHV